MVQGFWGNSSWGFPKGKVNADEDPFDCAIREVKEEIGFDCTKLIKETEFIEMNIRETFTRLYIVPGVNLAEKFQPMTRGEIKSIQWFPIKTLPINRADKEQNSNHYFVAIPFIKYTSLLFHLFQTFVFVKQMLIVFPFRVAGHSNDGSLIIEAR